MQVHPPFTQKALRCCSWPLLVGAARQQKPEAAEGDVGGHLPVLRRVCGSTDWVGARAGTRPFPVPPLAVGTEWGLRGTWRRTRGAAEVHFKHASSVPHGNRAVPVQWTRKWRFRSKAPCPGPHSQVGGGAGFACSVSSGWPRAQQLADVA